jgi:PAS domain S-box-containing protein
VLTALEDTNLAKTVVMASQPGSEDSGIHESRSWGDLDLIRENQLLRGQLEEARRHEAELLVRLAEAKSESETSRAARLAALNLMEDAILARRAEQEQNAERRRAEMAFRKSEARFRSLFQSMNEACCVVEKIATAAGQPADFRFVDANPSFLMQSGQAQIVGQSVQQVNGLKSSTWLEVCQTAFDADQPVKCEHELFSQPGIYEISAFKFRYDDHHQLALLLTDVTERKQAEAAMLEAVRVSEQLVRLEGELALEQAKREAAEAVRIMEERFRVFIDQNPAIAFIKDEEGRYIFVNRALELRSGRPIEAWLGKTDFDFFPKEDAEQYRRNELAVLTTKTAAQFSESASEADGRHQYLSYKFPMQDLEGKWFLAGTAFDVTRQKRAEEALAANEQRLRALAAEIAKIEYRERRRLAGILHEEVQQLLIAIQLRGAHIESQSSEPFIKEQASVLNRLVSTSIDTVRTLSRELVPPTLYQLGMGAGLEWLAGRFQQQHGLKVQVLADENADPNSDMLRDVIFHISRELLLNVVKHAQTDRAYISLRRQSAHLELIVCDDGVGLNSDVDLQRQDSFGLFQIRERLHSMGGALEFKSTPHAGLEVTAIIPIDEAERQKG